MVTILGRSPSSGVLASSTRHPYLFPSTVPSLASPSVSSQPIDAVELLSAFHRCFKGYDAELNHVDFEVMQAGTDLMRRTTVRRAGAVQKVSDMAAIRRA